MSGRSLLGLAVIGLGALAVGAALVPRGSKGSESKAGPLAVLVTGDLRGYLEPCGCSEHMLGGLDRSAGQVEAARKALGAAVHVSGGDSLFQARAIDEAHAQQDELKARAILGLFATLDTVAMAVGPRDLLHGPGFLTSAAPGFPFLDAGLGPKGAPGFTLVERGGIHLGIAAGDSAALLIANVKKARAAGAQVVIALATMTLKDLVPSGPALAQAGADLAFASHQASEVDGDEERSIDAGLPIVSVKNRGRSLLRIDLHPLPGAPLGFVRVASNEAHQKDLAARDAEIASLEKRAHAAQGPLKQAMDAKIAEKRAQRESFAAQLPTPPAGRSWLSYRFVELSDDKPSSPPAHALVDRYTAQVAELNLAWAKAHGRDCPAVKPGALGFVGTATCIGCHADPAAVYHGTAHSHAYATLEKVHKQFDLDCIRCHVTGMDAPGGVCRVDKVEGRKNVGCESCHGMGSLHAEDPGVAVPARKPSAVQCLVCHTAENSTQFDFATYLPKILGPGHGQPAKP